MSHYRRSKSSGATYFFTVVTYQRQKILCDEPVRNALRKAIIDTRKRYPFEIDAWVLLPDHLHCIWTLPDSDADFSKRWSIIKRKVSIVCADRYKNSKLVTSSKQKRRESTTWQRRFWEHQLRDQNDYNRHVEYIHYNAVKHGLCNLPSAWPYSTIHKYIKNGICPVDWAGDGDYDDEGFGE